MLKGGEGIVMGKTLEKQYNPSALSWGAVKKGPSQRLNYQEQKEPKAQDL